MNRSDHSEQYISLHPAPNQFTTLPPSPNICLGSFPVIRLVGDQATTKPALCRAPRRKFWVHEAMPSTGEWC